MGLFSKMFKRDQELEEQQRKRAMELQVELWQKQAELGQPVNIQADMEKIYGLDKLEQKQREKQQTKEIIKGAVVGGIVAGDAGAVVGAMVAKNKVDNSSNSSTTRSTTPAYVRQEPQATHYNQVQNTTPAMQERKAPPTKSSMGNDAPPVLKHYKSDKWNDVRNDLRNDGSWKTGDISKDVEYCIAKLEIVTLGDLAIITKEPANKTRPCITPLMEAKKVTRLEYDGRTYFAWEQGQYSTVNARKALSTAVALNYYNGDEWQNTKRTLMENGFTKTGRLEGDILYCLSQLKIATVSDLSDLLGESITVIRPKLTPLMEDETVKRVEHNNRAIFVMADANFNSQPAAPAAPANNINKFEEVKKFKELLDSGIITQEEFDAKKKNLLGL